MCLSGLTTFQQFNSQGTPNHFALLSSPVTPGFCRMTFGDNKIQCCFSSNSSFVRGKRSLDEY